MTNNYIYEMGPIKNIRELTQQDMIKKEWMWMYFNDEWNQSDDEDDETTYVDGVDERPSPKPKPYNDDDYDY
jgi:hypothetical protein